MEKKSCEGCFYRVEQDKPASGFECRKNPPQLLLIPIQHPPTAAQMLADPRGAQATIEMRPMGVFPPADRKCGAFIGIRNAPPETNVPA